jgi:hypothetical protein
VLKEGQGEDDGPGWEPPTGRFGQNDQTSVPNWEFLVLDRLVVGTYCSVPHN